LKVFFHRTEYANLPVTAAEQTASSVHKKKQKFRIEICPQQMDTWCQATIGFSGQAAHSKGWNGPSTEVWFVSMMLTPWAWFLRLRVSASYSQIKLLYSAHFNLWLLYYSH